MPDTTDYMLLGLIAVVGLMGMYTLVLVWRFHTVKRERRQIEGYQDAS